MRLIDADAIPEELLDYEFNGKYAGSTIRDILDMMPTITAVQVKRCKDCKHFGHNFEGAICYKDSTYRVLPSPNWFCGDWKGKTDDFKR